MNYVRPAIIALLALAALIVNTGQSSASSFNPSGTACLDDGGTVDPDPFNPGDPEECDGTTTLGAVSGITASSDLPNGDANFAALVTFIPPAWGIAADADVPDGAIAGQVNTQATLGIINGACHNILPIEFTLMDATTDTLLTVTFENGFAIAGGLPEAVTKYPDFLNRIFDDIVPRARLYGQTIVAGVDVSLNFVIFEPGTPVGSLTPDPRLGFPIVAVLQNFGDPNNTPAPNPITDFCSPLAASNIAFGVSKDNACTDTATLDPLCGVTGAVPAEGGGTDPDESGFIVRTNPSADGAFNLVTHAASQRDADNDGIENRLDTCPFDPNAGNPRSPFDGDADGDGLDAACDPNDVLTNSDEDLDGYLNRHDNCPQVPNGEFEDNQADTDMDGIGDACDTIANGSQGPTVPDGHFHAVCLVEVVQVGAGGTPSIDPQAVQPCDPDAPVDSDSDGFSNADEDSIGTDPFLACGPDAWPPDTYEDQLVDSQDMVALLPGLFKSVGQDGYDARLDIFQPGTIIDSQDLVAMVPFLFKSCQPP